MSKRLSGLLILLAVTCLSVRVDPGIAANPDAEDSERSRVTAAITHYFDQRHSGLSAEQVEQLAETIVATASGAELSPVLVLAVIEVESSGNNFAESHVGALGLMQLRPQTAKAVAQRIGVAWRGSSTLFDPDANVRLGVAYLKQMIDRYGELEVALAAYNWGPTRIANFRQRGVTIPVGYSQRVLSKIERAL